MIKITGRSVRTLLLAGLLALSTSGFAQDYPTKPIRLLIPAPPGGGTDILARVMADHLVKQFGQPIAGFQLTQKKIADMSLELQKAYLLALHLGRLKDNGQITPAMVSVGKLNNVREALAIAHESRSILGGNGITLEYSILRHANNLEAVLTYEGTTEIHTLVVDDVVGENEMITQFNIHGAMIYLDDNGKTTGYEDVFTKIEMCRKHYIDVGLGADYIDEFIR
jgi:hypothetical protein